MVRTNRTTPRRQTANTLTLADDRSMHTPAQGFTHRCTLRIAADHPALPGHFPGRPIVPGVVLLDCVLSEAERFLGQGLAARALSQVKFTSMLLPEEAAELELQLTDQSLRFAITRAGQAIATGTFTLGTTLDGRL